MAARAMRRYPISEVTEPKGGLHQIYVNYWWATSNDDEVYFYGPESSPMLSPQCNSNEFIVASFDKRAANKYPDTHFINYRDTRQIPLVFVPVNMSDYIH